MYDPSPESKLLLVKQLETASESEKPALLNELSESCVFGDPEEMRRYATEALEAARQTKNANQEARALRNQGISFHKSGILDQALKCLSEAELVSGCNDINIKSNIKLGISHVYISGGLLTQADHLLNEAWDGFQKSGSSFDLARVRLNQIQIAIRQQNLSQGVEYLKDAQKLVDDSNSKTLKGHLLMLRGHLNIEQLHINEAIENYLNAVEFMEDNHFCSALIEGLSKLAYCYQQSGNLEKSNLFATKAIEQNGEAMAPRPVVDSYRILAENAAKAGNFSFAYTMTRKANQLEELLRKYALNSQRMMVGSVEQTQIELQKRVSLERITRSQNIIIVLVTLLLVSCLVAIGLLVWHNSILKKTRAKERALTLQLQNQQQVIQENNHQLTQTISHRDRLYSIIAHDLKSPIGALNALMQSLSQEDLGKQETATILRDLAPTVQNTYQMIERLVEWAQTQQMALNPAPQTLDIAAILDEVTQQIAPYIQRKNIRLESKLEASFPVYFDPGMLLSILRSLLFNAVKFTYPDGIIHIESNQETNGVSITNSGMKIPEKIIEAVKTHQTVESSFGTSGEKGTGLGLVLTQALLNANNGSMAFETGSFGTRVILILPKPPLV